MMKAKYFLITMSIFLLYSMPSILAWSYAQPSENFIINTTTAQYKPLNQTWLDLDGLDDYINISDDDYFSANNITGDLSVSFWVKIPSFQFNGTDGTTGYIEIAGKGRTGWNNPEWGFRVYNASNTAARTCRMTMYFWNITGGEGAGAYVQINDTATSCTTITNRWLHVVGVLNESRISLWIDGRKDGGGSGSLLSTYAIKDGMMPGDSAVRFGTRQTTGFLNCSIDDIQIFNRSINHTEVLAMNATQRNGTVVNSTALVGRWRLNENNGSIVRDTSGRGIDGTIVGGGYWDNDGVFLNTSGYAVNVAFTGISKGLVFWDNGTTYGSYESPYTGSITLPFYWNQTLFLKEITFPCDAAEVSLYGLIKLMFILMIAVGVYGYLFGFVHPRDIELGDITMNKILVAFIVIVVGMAFTQQVATSTAEACIR